jgi:uncharacterized protein YegL
MAKIIALGEPVNDWERAAIGWLREHLPAEHTILHSFWVERDRQRYEVDMAVVAPHAVYLVDVKGWRGPIHADQRKWSIPGKSEPSPLKKLEAHAKEMARHLQNADVRLRNANAPYVHAAVILAHPDAVFHDYTNRQTDVVYLRDAAAYLQDPTRLPDRFQRGRIQPTAHRIVVDTIRGGAVPRTGPIQFGGWVVTATLRAEEDLVEYAAYDKYSRDAARIRVYRVEPYAGEVERGAEANQIKTSYLALRRLSHPSVARVRGFFETDDNDGFVLVTEDVPGEVLSTRLARSETIALPAAMELMRDVLSGLAHAHSRDVVHRKLEPDAIVLGDRAVLTEFDYAKTPRVEGSSIMHRIGDQIAGPYAAPECHDDPAKARASSDVYSAGIIFYELLVGARPFDTPEAVKRTRGAFPHPPSAIRLQLPPGFDEWLQGLCAYLPEERPTAAEALEQLDALLVSPDRPIASPVEPDVVETSHEPEPSFPSSETMSPITEFTVAAARPLPVILLLDRSGSMTTESKIDVLNESVDRMIRILADEDAGLAEVHAAVFTFGGSTAVLHTPLRPARDVQWSPLAAAGKTPMGGALDLATQLIEDREQLPSRAYRPTLVLVTDGKPTDDWRATFERFQSSERAAKAFRLALAIGSDADVNLLQDFVGPDGRVFTADKSHEIRSFFKFVTMSVTARTRSNSPNAPVEFDDTDLDALGF